MNYMTRIISSIALSPYRMEISDCFGGSAVTVLTAVCLDSVRLSSYFLEVK